MTPFTTLTSGMVPLPNENVDTDQIIPARYLKTTNKEGLGAAVFADWRYAGDGTPRPEFILNQPQVAGKQILVAGNNFGCGSSREHAPWALMAYGFRAIISTSFADIFRNNSLKNGLLPVVVDHDTHAYLFSLLDSNPATVVTLDLPQQRLILPDGLSVPFPIDPFAKQCMVRGVDTAEYLLGHQPAIAEFETSRVAWA
jgi:3-isopropylmalate/(R)-2-methylmalate dehydratase small subunit